MATKHKSGKKPEKPKGGKKGGMHGPMASGHSKGGKY